MRMYIVNRRKYVKESFDIIIKMYPPIIDIRDIEIYSLKRKYVNVPVLEFYNLEIEELMPDWDNLFNRNYYIDGLVNNCIEIVLSVLCLKAHLQGIKYIHRDSIKFNDVMNEFIKNKYFSHTPVLKIYDENGNCKNPLKILKNNISMIE